MGSASLQDAIDDNVRSALAEDLGSGDITARLIAADALSEAVVFGREDAVLCGCAWFDAVFRALDDSVRIHWKVRDGETFQPDEVLCELAGPSRSLLSGERTALNFLQTLSATATLTRRYVTAIEDTSATIQDTRKTLPGLRIAQKYAVRCGGGENHRVGLYDGILIKENHILATGGLRHAIEKAREQAPGLPLEVEVESLDELQEAIMAGVERVLLDNFSLEDLGRAVSLNAGRARLEASGGIMLTNVRSVAETGVDYISIGDLTKNLRAVDLSMRFSTG